MKTVSCPSCGAPMPFQYEGKFLKCEYCGSIFRGETDTSTLLLEKEVRSIINTKPYGWEFKLFFASISLGLQQVQGKKNAFLSPLQLSESISKRDMDRYLNFMNKQMELLPTYTLTLHRIFSIDIPEAMGPDGLPGDSNKILLAANSIVSFYIEILNWGLEFQTRSIPDNLKGIVLSAKDIAKSILEDVENFCYIGHNNFKNLQPGMKVPAQSALVLRPMNLSAFMSELRSLQNL